MDIVGFCTQSSVIIVAGKGGVGKTTVSAAMARTAARSGLSVLIVELEGKSGLTSALGHPELLTYDEAVLSPDGAEAPDGKRMAEIRARTLTPDDALLEYLVDHGLRRVSKRLVNSGALDVVATAVPGIRDILVLGKVKQLERARRADLIPLPATPSPSSPAPRACWTRPGWDRSAPRRRTWSSCCPMGPAVRSCW
jgi:anion-transporting  ArsA/GET3 family ATPase